MQIEPKSIFVSQTQNEAKYNVTFNFTLPFQYSLQHTPMVNFQITIPKKSIDEGNIQTQEKNEEQMKVQPQNKMSNINCQLETFRDNRHSNRDILVKTQTKVKIQDKSPTTPHQRHLERSRTRDFRTNPNTTIQSKPHLQSIKTLIEKNVDLISRIERNDRCRKLNFSPLHNEFDARYIIINRNYKLNLGLGNFIITNRYQCQQRHKTYIKFSVQDNSCSMGITTYTKDLLKYPLIKSRYMGYSFKTNQMSVGKAVYSGKKVEDPTLKVFICLVDLIEKKFEIINQDQVIRSDRIPDQFLFEKIHFYIELNQKGKIAFL